jgi:hypothetical protein
MWGTGSCRPQRQGNRSQQWLIDSICSCKDHMVCAVVHGAGSCMQDKLLPAALTVTGSRAAHTGVVINFAQLCRRLVVSCVVKSVC